MLVWEQGRWQEAKKKKIEGGRQKGKSQSLRSQIMEEQNENDVRNTIVKARRGK